MSAFYTITDNKSPITIIFGTFSSQSVLIERRFYFPHHLSSAAALPWKITEHKNEKFSRR